MINWPVVLRERRKELGMSQEEVARRAGVSLNLINRLERGVVADPHISTLFGIASALDTKVSVLIGENQVERKLWGGR